MIYHVATNCILGSFVWTFGVVTPLALAKLFRGIQQIAMGEILYWLVNKVLCLYFHDIFFNSHVIPLIWGGNYGWVWNDGSWCLNCFEHPSQSGGVHMWTLQMPSTPSLEKSSSKNFTQQVFNYINFCPFI